MRFGVRAHPYVAKIVEDFMKKSSSKLSSRIFCFGASLALLTFCHAVRADWQLLNLGDGAFWWFDPQRVTKSNGVVTLWVKSEGETIKRILVEKYKTDGFIELSQKIDSEYGYSLNKWGLDCSKKMFSLYSSVDYSVSGVPLGSAHIKGGTAWQDVLPDSLMEGALVRMCAGKSKLK